MELQSERNYGIDLLRIVSMILIVFVHLQIHGGLLSGAEVGTANYYIVWLIHSVAFCAVNCFGLISGYVMVERKFHYSNILVLWLRVVFYTVIITAITVICVKDERTFPMNYVDAFLPVISQQYWYFTSYFAMFFFIPFFNYILNTFEKSKLTMLILSMFFVFTLVNMFAQSSQWNDPFKIDSGYSPLWLSCLYIYGGYLKKYGTIFINSKRARTIAFAVCIIVTAGWKYLGDALNKKNIFVVTGGKFYNYAFPTLLIMSIIIVVFFAKLNVREKYIKAISFLSPLSFSVYIIHEQPLFRKYLISGRFTSLLNLNPFLFVLALIGSALGIYFGLSAIDVVRAFIFKKLKLSEKCRKLTDKITDFITKKLKLKESQFA